jgi:hypothetical protein
MLLIYTLAVFLSATLLFLVQPMVAKLILPMLGGTPGVWNTCMVFFQGALLLGYAYAHVLGKVRNTRVQVSIHLGVLALAGLLLPIGLPKGEGWTPPPDASPIPWTFLILLVSVGGPFLALSAAGPLLQRWFAGTNHAQAKDPYFLYAASNAGSMLALLGYPLVVEPGLTVGMQSWWWSWGYVALGLAFVGCGVFLIRRPGAGLAGAAASAAGAQGAGAGGPVGALSWGTRARWVLLAAVPSSLMLGTTQYLTLDVAAVPLLWVVPLALYLLTFILAFGPLGWFIGRVSGWLLVSAVLAVFMAIVRDLRSPMWLLFAIHLSALFAGAMSCHGRLSEERPHPSRLTEFYLLIALGGVIGGMFNALLAPQVFKGLSEYPIALVLALALRAPTGVGAWRADRPAWRGRVSGMLDIGLPVLAGAVYLWIDQGWLNVKPLAERLAGIEPLQARTGMTTSDWQGVLVWALPVLLALSMAAWRWRFALCAAMLLGLPALQLTEEKKLLYVERTFFGVLKVFEEKSGSGAWHQLWHGRILHGKQYTQKPWQTQPTSYYAWESPVGDLFKERMKRRDFDTAAFVGMGTATLSVFGAEGFKFTYYEIDPGVVRIAQNPELFTYYRDSKAEMSVVLGDARLTLGSAPDGKYDLIMLDAFSSDAIPIHLITREAVATFMRKVSQEGLLVYHITNRYLDLEPVLKQIAGELGLEARVREDYSLDAERRRLGHYPSAWLMLVRKDEAPAAMGALRDDPRWRPLQGMMKKIKLPPVAPGEPERSDFVEVPLRTWTDDYSDILSIFKWR